ncbi:uncharacterized protein J5F26_006799 isoform 1-T1 [Ciconia maguari]
MCTTRLFRDTGEVQRGSRSCGLPFSFLTEKSGTGGTVAWGRLPPLAPSDNELSCRIAAFMATARFQRRRATSRSSNSWCEVMSKNPQLPHVFLPIDEDQLDGVSSTHL